ncbi:hypothetical protein D3875_06785 [Deinococcus cavernae]|uniref:Uncharacterized protein n=1 Tax=Deinococcus cavernae TaxID=2320857 RepID=A0A418V5D4_9DEIO|nr:hypothetical protein D3875_06785 [Deinococcus cavernae]
MPKWFALPNDALDAGVVTLAQNVEWSDADAFAAARETVVQYGPGNAPQSPEVVVTPTCGLHRTDPDGLELAPTPLTGIPAAPQRLNLRVGQFARFEWNERLTGEAVRYRHTIINVALTAAPLPADLLARLPDFYLSHMVDLNERRYKARRAG